MPYYLKNKLLLSGRCYLMVYISDIMTLVMMIEESSGRKRVGLHWPIEVKEKAKCLYPYRHYH